MSGYVAQKVTGEAALPAEQDVEREDRVLNWHIQTLSTPAPPTSTRCAASTGTRMTTLNGLGTTAGWSRAIRISPGTSARGSISSLSTWWTECCGMRTLRQQALPWALQRLGSDTDPRTGQACCEYTYEERARF